MSPTDIKTSICSDFGEENNVKNPKFKIDDHARKSKYKKNAKAYK